MHRSALKRELVGSRVDRLGSSWRYYFLRNAAVVCWEQEY